MSSDNINSGNISIYGIRSYTWVHLYHLLKKVVDMIYLL
jgi:hypothetical protein